MTPCGQMPWPSRKLILVSPSTGTPKGKAGEKQSPKESEIGPLERSEQSPVQDLVNHHQTAHGLRGVSAGLPPAQDHRTSSSRHSEP